MKIGHKTNLEELLRLGFKYVAEFGNDCSIWCNDTHSTLLDADSRVVLFYEKDPKATIYENDKTSHKK